MTPEIHSRLELLDNEHLLTLMVSMNKNIEVCDFRGYFSMWLICVLPLSSPLQSIDLTLSCTPFSLAYHISFILNNSIVLRQFIKKQDDFLENYSTVAEPGDST